MPPQYGYLENNLWQQGGGASQQMGDAFTRAIVGTAALQHQREMQAQQAMFEAQRIQMEQAKLMQQAPLIRAQTAYEQSGADFNRARTTDLQGGMKAGGILGDALKGMVGTDPQVNPDVYKLLQSIVAQQQGVLAAQNPANIGKQVPEILYGSTPQGREKMIMGYPQSTRQYATPEQQAAVQMVIEGMRLAGHPITTTDITGRKTEEVDVPGAMDIGQTGLRQIFPGSTNLPHLNIGVEPTLASSPTPAPAATGKPAIPKVGEVRKGYRFKGGDPAQQANWEVVK